MTPTWGTAWRQAFLIHWDSMTVATFDQKTISPPAPYRADNQTQKRMQQ
jgi:hypothetical protein